MILESNHSAYPVCDGDIDEILGIVKVKSLLNNYLNQEHASLRSLITPVSFIHETASAFQVLKQFRITRSYHAFLIDEYGRSKEHTSELKSLMRISYAVFRWK